MTAFKVPGVQGLYGDPLYTYFTEDCELRWDRHRVPTGDHGPGPVGLRLVPQGVAAKKKAQAAPAKPTALIISTLIKRSFWFYSMPIIS